MYQARILDKDRQLKAVLPGVRWHYNRRINEATSVEVYIPKETIDEHITPDHALYGFFAPSQPFAVQAKPQRAKPNKAQYAEIAAYIQIYKGDTLKVTGKINSRTIGQIVTIQAYTEEILLEGNQTPAQYGKVYDNWDLANVAKDMLDGWQSLRVKAQSQWQQYMVDSHRVDLTTDPGLVMLAKRSNGRYYDTGYIDLMFSSGEIAKFRQWDRIRWSADSEDPVKTTVQFGYDGANWSQEFDGGFPEEVGIGGLGNTETLYVRVNLYTNDTESEDPEGNPVGVTPTVFAVELIARTERGELVAGNIPSVAGVTVKGINADYSSTFQVLLDACEQVGWEFSVWNGALNIAENLGADRTKDFVLRAGTNIEITSLGDDDEELVNVLTAYGPGRGINRMEIALRDEASIAQFGEYPLAMEFDTEKLPELEQKAQEFLDEHNLPKTQFEVAVAFDHDKEPDYGLGDKVRVADPETGIVTTARIMSEAREYGESGLVVSLELGKAGLNLQAVLEGEPAKRPVDPFTPTGVWARGIVRGIRVGFSRPKGDWDSSEVHVSTAPGFMPSGGTLKDTGKQTQFDIQNLEVGTRYYVRVVNVDSRGDKSEPSREVSAVPITMQEEQLKDYTDGVADYVEGLSPILLVSELPTLPDPRYPDGTIVFLITDEKLYRNTGGNWTLLISMNFEDLEGKLQSNQIALEAITEELIAARAITKTKIEDDSIETPKLAAGAVVADKIGANAVTANKIAAGAVTSEKIYAGAVTAEKLDANAVTADMVVAGIIQAGGIKADWYADIRNVLPYTGQDSLDSDKPIVIPFYIPSETTKIVAAFLSAEARRYRAYSKSAPYDPSAFWDKQTSGTSFNSPAVTVDLSQTSANTGQTTLDHVHQYSDTHITSSTGGGHTHALNTSAWPKLYTDYSSPDNHRHTFDSFSIPSNSGAHAHSTTNTNKNTGGPRTGAIGNTSSTLAHTHTYQRVTGVTLSNFANHFHDYDPAHDHKLEFGIHEDSTAAGVRMRVHNGTSWSSYITLASAPSDNAAYDLISGASVPKHNNNASEMDLTSYLSGTGWKHIEFSSSRLGLIAWNIILKLDLTA